MLDSKELMMESLLRMISMTASAFCHLILTQMKISKNQLSGLSMSKTIDQQPLNVRIDLESFKQQKLNLEKNPINNKFMAISKRINRVQHLKCNHLARDMINIMKKILIKNSLLDTPNQIIMKLLLLILSKLSLFC